MKQLLKNKSSKFPQSHKPCWFMTIIHNQMKCYVPPLKTIYIKWHILSVYVSHTLISICMSFSILCPLSARWRTVEVSDGRLFIEFWTFFNSWLGGVDFDSTSGHMFLQQNDFRLSSLDLMFGCPIMSDIFNNTLHCWNVEFTRNYLTL